jgi:tryptophanyl-tRNA synthetase
MLIDGVPSPIFSADTFAPHKKDDNEFKERYEKILQVSREKYCKPKKLVVEKINKMLEGVEEREEKIEKENKREK